MSRLKGENPALLKEVRKLFKDYWDYSLKSSPSTATFVGFHKYNDRLEDLTESAHKKTLQEFKKFHNRIKKIHLQGLPLEDQISVRVLERSLSLGLKGDKFPGRFLAMNQLEGPHLSFLHIAAVTPFNNFKDYQNYLKRLTAYSKTLIQTIELLKKGVKKGWTQPRPVAEAMIPQIEKLIIPDEKKSPLYEYPNNHFKNLKKGEIEKFNQNYQIIYQKEILPALRKMLLFLTEKYLPASRKECGLGTLPEGGLDYYQICVELQTTTQKTPDEIHKMGKGELKRIHKQMDEIKTKLNFNGTLREFFIHMREKPELHYKTRAEIVKNHTDLLKKMEKKLPKYFGRLPKNPYRVIPMEEYREKNAPDAYYMPGDSKSGRAGTYYVNTYQPETRGRFNAEVLAYHEAIPGHHLQIAIAQELENTPEFRKWGGVNAYVEGWALYTEKLCQEMGGYQTLESQFGKLSFEAWRACRLVIDTGLHAKNWTRNKAIKFFQENTGLSEHNITVEVDRYMVLPAQALSYKIGEIFLMENRARLEKLLGKKFNIKSFHDEVLGYGAVPLDILEMVLNRWADTKK